jgi:hypothetical protein
VQQQLERHVAAGAIRGTALMESMQREEQAAIMQMGKIPHHIGRARYHSRLGLLR